MLKILYFDHWQGASEFYRTMPLDYITHPDFTITRTTERDIKAHTLNLYDILFIVRPSSEVSLNLIKLAKDMHKKIIIDWDDDALHLPNDVHPHFYNYEGDKTHTISCLTLADEVWVATEGIKKAYRLYNKNIHVIPNAHNDFIFKIEDKKPFKYNKIAMWRGGFSHIGDIYAPGTAEGLVKLINGNKSWSFYFLGQRFEWLEMRVKHGNYYRHTGASTVQFYKLMHDYNASIFFYPLATNLFNQSKSNCSWLESSYAGSAYFGNLDLPEFNKPGIESLKHLPGFLKGNGHPAGLPKMNAESWTYICDNLLVSQVNKLRIERLETFIK